MRHTGRNYFAQTLFLVIASVAVVEICLGLGLLLIDPPDSLPPHSPALILAIQVAVCGFVGGYLFLRGVGEDAKTLGVSYLVVASAYAYSPASSSAYTTWVGLFPLPVFLPFTIWQFSQQFPTRSFKPTWVRWNRLISIALLCVAVFLLLSNWFPATFDSAGRFKRSPPSLYSPIVYSLALLALLGMAIEFKSASSADQERARFFLLALGLPMFVLTIYFAMSALPFAQSIFLSEQGKVVLIPLFHAVMLSIPISTGYAIAMNRAVRLRVLFTLFARYRLARFFSWFLVVVPILAIVGLLWSSKAQSLENIASSIYGVMLGVFTIIGLTAYQFRGKVTASIERTFFREAYNSSSTSASLGALLPQAKSAEDIVKIVGQELSKVVHFPNPSLFIKGEQQWVDLANLTPPLPIDSALIWNLEEQPATPESLAPNPTSELKSWIKKTEIQLLTPINTAGGKLVGAVATGKKLSGLSYTEQDKDLLSTSARLVLPHLQRVLADPRIVDVEPGSATCAMCTSCNLVTEIYQDECPKCRGDMQALGIPKVIAGKYDIERCVGHGAAGLALLARDKPLDRRVVLKTLPNIQPEAVQALQKEAKSMASLDHPSIATVFGIESWRGLPILVMEYLEGGTLAELQAVREFSPMEVRALAERLLAACVYLHGKQQVHGDIKPSNIGFDAQQRPKLFDFGLSRTIDQSEVADSCLTGTPLYLMPELFAGAPLDERADLWALSITLYEITAGKHPIPKDNLSAILLFLRNEEIPPLTEALVPNAKSLRNFLFRSLARDPQDRPQSASEALELLTGSANDRSDQARRTGQ